MIKRLKVRQFYDKIKILISGGGKDVSLTYCYASDLCTYRSCTNLDYSSSESKSVGLGAIGGAAESYWGKIKQDL